MLENVSEAIMHAFGKTRQKDDQVVAVRDMVSKLEENLTQLDKMASRLNRRQADLAVDFEEFSESCEHLSHMEPEITVQLDSFAKTIGRNASALKEAVSLGLFNNTSSLVLDKKL